jgi:methyl-CpG-binding domain protein 4
MMTERVWLPPRSPFSLIQEDVWPDRWLIIVVSMLLNCTRRKQVERILPEFRRRWSAPATFLRSNQVDVVELIKPLGFATRRATNLRSMTQRFIMNDWNDPRALPGVGEYCARAYEIFSMGKVGIEPPDDHALKLWHAWYIQRTKR